MQPYWYKAQVIRIVDGDTVDLRIDLGLKVSVAERCRLAGINSPETYGVSKTSPEYQEGMKTVARLTELLSSQPTYIINTVKDTQEKYGRYLVWIYTAENTKSINLQLVDEGLAKVY